MKKTNIGLVEYAEKAYAEKWGYVWGTFGQVLNERLFQEKLRQYPKGVGNYQTFIRQNWLGRRTSDCVGLIKSYMWYDERTKQIRYTPTTDVNADGMYQRARKKGALSSIPEIPGICVWRKGHIGVYIGNGEVIEAQGTKYGVRKNKLKSRTFTHWLECPYIEYINPAKPSITVPPTKGVTEVRNNPASWAKADWDWCKQKGYLDGTRPYDNITRQELAVLVRRIVEGR